MATIGLDRLYYAKITENDAGEEPTVRRLSLRKPSPLTFRWNWQRRHSMPTTVLQRS